MLRRISGTIPVSGFPLTLPDSPGAPPLVRFVGLRAFMGARSSADEHQHSAFTSQHLA